MKSLAALLLLAPLPALAHPTVEANAGLGEVYGFAAPTAGIGAGASVTERFTLGVRVTALRLSPSIDPIRRTYAVAGPSAQLWLDEHVWLGAAIGPAIMAFSTGDHIRGWGTDLRVGYALDRCTLALELVPSYFPNAGAISIVDNQVERAGVWTRGLALTLGYQLR